jgi:hypothetical protein
MKIVHSLLMTDKNSNVSQLAGYENEDESGNFCTKLGHSQILK